MSRYTLPDPRCRHKQQTMRVSSHVDLAEAVKAGEPTASTYCCERIECVEDAKEWVWASSHRSAHLVPLRFSAVSA